MMLLCLFIFINIICYYNSYIFSYLLLFSIFTGVSIPEKKEYLIQIHSTAPKCMIPYKEKYKENPDFYKKSNEISRESIKSFIEIANLDKTKLTDYFQRTQTDKIYMLYYHGEFKMETVNFDDYRIIDVTKNPQKYRFECISKSGKQLQVLLRWKNGNGIALPAFQIKSIKNLGK